MIACSSANAAFEIWMFKSLSDSFINGEMTSFGLDLCPPPDCGPWAARASCLAQEMVDTWTPPFA